MTRWLPLLFLVVWTGALFSQSEPITPEANPGRPTVSTPATSTPIGYLQFETGAFGATDSPEFSTRISANEVVKLTVHPRVQLLLGFEPIAHTIGEKRANKTALPRSLSAYGGPTCVPRVSPACRAAGSDRP